MKINKKKPTRKFNVGIGNKITISHVADITLNSDEMVTFVSKNGAEHDFAAKNWGYYTTPSINTRLKNNRIKTALVENTRKQLFIMTVFDDKVDEFLLYLKNEEQNLIEWLDERVVASV